MRAVDDICTMAPPPLDAELLLMSDADIFSALPSPQKIEPPFVTASLKEKCVLCTTQEEAREMKQAPPNVPAEQWVNVLSMSVACAPSTTASDPPFSALCACVSVSV